MNFYLVRWSCLQRTLFIDKHKDAKFTMRSTNKFSFRRKRALKRWKRKIEKKVTPVGKNLEKSLEEAREFIINRRYSDVTEVRNNSLRVNRIQDWHVKLAHNKGLLESGISRDVRC